MDGITVPERKITGRVHGFLVLSDDGWRMDDNLPVFTKKKREEETQRRAVQWVTKDVEPQWDNTQMNENSIPQNNIYSDAFI